MSLVDRDIFEDMDDATLASAYKDYRGFCKTGTIPDGTVLGKARDAYCERSAAHGLIQLQVDFLEEVAKRWAQEQGIF